MHNNFIDDSPKSKAGSHTQLRASIEANDKSMEQHDMDAKALTAVKWFITILLLLAILYSCH
jgi:hypothetical protein